MVTCSQNLNEQGVPSGGVLCLGCSLHRGVNANPLEPSMSKLPWKPWHKVVQLRPDLRSGELSLAVFAAHLYDVVMGRARKVYADPKEFFALTYPTFNLRELAKDV